MTQLQPIRKLYLLLIVISICLAAACSPKVKSGSSAAIEAPVTISGKDLSPLGRTRISPEGLELISSASHFAFEFTGKEFEITASLPTWMDHNYLQYELDGVYVKRIRVEKGEARPLVIPAGSAGKHTVRIFKATEAHTGAIFVREVKAFNARALTLKKLPLIEFIGNSITCGALSDSSEVPCGQGNYHDQHNAYLAYGPRVARTLGTNFILNSVSGIGIYRTWNTEGPSMPQVYRKYSFQANDTGNWDFTQYKPQVISIALGTNDLSDGDGKNPRSPFNSEIFITNYIKFIDTLKTIHPEAQIALLSSPMMGGERRELLQTCLEKVKLSVDQKYPGDKPVALHFFKEMIPTGCSWHPSTSDHKIMADELVPFFKKLIK